MEGKWRLESLVQHRMGAWWGGVQFLRDGLCFRGVLWPFDSWFFGSSYRNPAEEYEEKPRKVLQQGKGICVQVPGRTWALRAESAPQVSRGGECQSSAWTSDAAAQLALLHREWWGRTSFCFSIVSIVRCFLVEHRFLNLGCDPWVCTTEWVSGSWWTCQPEEVFSTSDQMLIQSQLYGGLKELKACFAPPMPLSCPLPVSAAHCQWVLLKPPGADSDCCLHCVYCLAWLSVLVEMMVSTPPSSTLKLQTPLSSDCIVLECFWV